MYRIGAMYGTVGFMSIFMIAIYVLVIVALVYTVKYLKLRCDEMEEKKRNKLNNKDIY